MFSQSFQFKQEKEAKPDVRIEEPSWIGAQFTSKNGSQVIRFRRDGFSFHRLSPYTSFAALTPELVHYWEEFQSMTTPRTLPLIALRFINRIRVPDEVKPEQLKDYVNVQPPLALTSGVQIQETLSRIRFMDEDSGLKGAVSYSRESSKPSLPLEFLLDVEVRSDKGFAPQDPEIWNEIDVMRGLRNRIFTLTSKCLELFG